MVTQIVPKPQRTQIAGQPVLPQAPAPVQPPASNAPGPPGLSAYQIAVLNGFVGTEGQWLASLSGAPPRYTHTQSTPATTWTVNHNFGFIPQIVAFSAGSVVMPLVAVANPTLNQSIIAFNTPTSGFAVCQ